MIAHFLAAVLKFKFRYSALNVAKYWVLPCEFLVEQSSKAVFLRRSSELELLTEKEIEVVWKFAI